MPLKLDQSKTYRWTVPVEYVDEAGKTVTGEFTAIFKRMRQSEIDGLVKPDGEQTLTDTDFIKLALLGWDGLTDSDGNTLVFNEENLATFLDTHPYRQMTIRAWYQSIAGAPRKNSKT